jgi:hypothetical protein
MMRRPLLFVLLVAGCSKPGDADLQYIGQARSLGAEWALLNQQASRGNLTGTYTRTMRENVRKQLDAAAKALTIPHSRYGREMQDLLTEPDDASPQELRVHVDKLKEIEDSVESP